MQNQATHLFIILSLWLLPSQHGSCNWIHGQGFVIVNNEWDPILNLTSNTLLAGQGNYGSNTNFGRTVLVAIGYRACTCRWSRRRDPRGIELYQAYIWTRFVTCILYCFLCSTLQSSALYMCRFQIAFSLILVTLWTQKIILWLSSLCEFHHPP